MAGKKMTILSLGRQFVAVAGMSIALVLFSSDSHGDATNNCQTWVDDHYETRPCDSGYSPPESSRRWEREQEEIERINRDNELMMRAKELSQQGDALYDAGRYREALDLYLEANRFWDRWTGDSLERRIRNSRSMILVTDARAASEAGNYDHAARLFREAISINPDNAFRWEDELAESESDSYTKKGVELIDQGNYQKAESVLTKAVKIFPKSSWAYKNLGRALFSQKRYKEAEVFFLQAVQLNPDSKGAHYLLGLTLQNQERYSEAEAAYRQAIRLDPNYSDAYNNLGAMLSQQGREIEAEAAYRQLIRIYPNDPDAYGSLGDVLKYQGRYSESEEAYRQALKLDPNHPWAHYNLGLVFERQNRFPEAEGAYRKAAELKPNDPSSYERLGDMLKRQNRYEEAEVAYGKALGIDPFNQEIQDSLRSLSTLKQAEVAEKHSKASLNKPLDEMSLEARKGFDTGGSAITGPSPVDARGVVPDAVPEKIASHPTYQALQVEENALTKQREAIWTELAEIRQRKEATTTGPDRRWCLVQEAKAEQQLANIQSQIGVVKVKKKDFIVTFKEEEDEAPKEGKR